MKTKSSILSILIFSFLLMGICPSAAQVEVTKGSTHTYSVTPIPMSAAYDYHWSVTPGGTSSIFDPGDTSNSVVWDGSPGNYTIFVYPAKSAAVCAGNTQTLLISVVDMHIEWITNNSIQCPKTDNESGDFIITANYTGVSGKWGFSYCIDEGTPQTVNITSGNSQDIIIPGFTNASNSSSAAHSIRITSVSTADNYTVTYTGVEADAAAHLYNIIIEATPGTSGIIQL